MAWGGGESGVKGYDIYTKKQNTIVAHFSIDNYSDNIMCLKFPANFWQPARFSEPY